MTLKDRENLFRQEVDQHDYPEKMRNDFFNYWSEPNKREKMRFELEKTWCTKRRLAKWSDNQNKWNADSKTKPGTSQARTEALRGW